LLIEILHKKVKDKRFMRYMARIFKAGMLAGRELKVSEEGVPQGSLCSPVLANIFAHEVLDKWFEETVKAHCAGKVELFRYCDDVIICCRSKKDAHRVRKALHNRFAKYKLKLNEEKTRSVSFSKIAYRRGIRQEVFDFLGFTFYWGRSSQGAIITKVKTSGKRMRAKLKRVNIWCRAVRNRYRLEEIWKMFSIKLEGHIRYYGVSYNTRGVKVFKYRSRRILFGWLNRRSQRKSFTWERFEKMEKFKPLPRARICHSLL
jgi:hypothetical protein